MTSWIGYSRVGAASWLGAGALALQLFASVAGTTGCGDDGGAGGGGGAGGEESINGCTESDAEDMTGMTDVTLTWTNPHQKCIKVDTGTNVTWDGDFTLHPIADGSPDTGPENGPLTNADQTGTTVSVIYASAGTNPYFCKVHNATMQGVVYVR
ncbi:MAG: hypothetical protein U0271_42770 [Polyangiaceae bacterium]